MAWRKDGWQIQLELNTSSYWSMNTKWWDLRLCTYFIQKMIIISDNLHFTQYEVPRIKHVLIINSYLIQNIFIGKCCGVIWYVIFRAILLQISKEFNDSFCKDFVSWPRIILKDLSALYWTYVVSCYVSVYNVNKLK